MPRQIFKNRVIAAAGPLPEQFTVDNLKQWTILRKGRFSLDLDESVTHLLCTREQYDRKVPRIKDAMKRGKSIHIVHFDWFEFSSVAEKKLPEREYSMRQIDAKRRAVNREKARIDRGRREGIKAVNSSLFHIYQDREFFPYQVDITRDDADTGDLGQRYTLYLWESNAKPSLYWFVAKFLKRKGNSQPSFYRPSPYAGKWRPQMELFMDFFYRKTGIEWQDRVLRAGTMPPAFFSYAPPGGGKPVGRRLRFSFDYCKELNAKLLADSEKCSHTISQIDHTEGGEVENRAGSDASETVIKDNLKNINNLEGMTADPSQGEADGNSYDPSFDVYQLPSCTSVIFVEDGLDRECAREAKATDQSE